MTADAATLAFYDGEAATYARHWPDEPHRDLAPFLARLRPGARVLELGCGTGRDAAAMLARGFDVDATDGSAAMAREAEARLGRPVRVMRFDELTAIDAYDAVWAAASLLHVPRDDLPDVLKRIRRALTPGGLHYASYKAAGAQSRDRFGRLFNQLAADEAHDAYVAEGDWQLLAVEQSSGGGYDGVTTPWVAITARRPTGDSKG